MGTTSPKVCVVCGTDCSHTPRVKDPRGRYFCKPCYEEALKRKKGDSAADSRDADHGDRSGDRRKPTAGWSGSLLDDSDDGAAAGTCPECGAALDVGAVLCVNCGYVLRAGKHITPEVVEGDEAEGEEQSDEGGAPRGTKWPIVIGVFSLIFAIFGALQYGVTTVAIALTPPSEAGGPMFWALGVVLLPALFALAVALGVLAIGLFMRRAFAPVWLVRWAWAKIIVSVVWMASLGALFAVEVPPDLAAFGVAILAIAIIPLLIWLLFWPVFILLWLRRKVIREEVARWT